MASSLWGSAGLFGAVLLLTASNVLPVQATVPLNLCADFNTASMAKNDSIYQTNGLCSDWCRGENYAYSITQVESCWCSNYTPAKDTEVDLDKCDITCPAWPDEKCGGDGLYGYVELDAQPSGTKGDDTASSTASDTASSTTKTKSSKPSTTKAVTATITSGGQTKTVTVMPTLIPTVTETGTGTGTGGSIEDSEGADSSNSAKKDDGGLGTGPIVGIVVGVVGAALIAAGAFAFWFFKRRKRNDQNGYEDDPSVRRGSSSDRMGSAHPEMSMGGGSPTMGSSNRNSALAIDPRMDPFKQGLYMRNGSHESINTLRDDHDYSRRILRATNPDPDNAG